MKITLIGKQLMLIIVLSSFGCGRDSELEKTVSDDSTLLTLAESSNSRGHNWLGQNYFPNAKVLEFSGIYPNAESARFWSFSETSLNEKDWNHRNFPNGTKAIFIAGKKIVIKPGHASRLYERLQNRYDIKSLTIQAETIELGGILKLPSVNISILTENFIVRSGGMIDTTAPEYLTTPSPFTDGNPGLTGGAIELFGKNLQIDHSGPIFISNGGKGQNAGPGQQGVSGVSLPDLGSGAVYKQLFKHFCWCANESDRPGCRQRCENDLIAVHGIPQCPTNGEPARPGGKPGNGGSPGAITSNLELPPHAVFGVNGKSGESAGTYAGGNAGTPIAAVHQVYVNNNLQSTSNCARTSAGAPAHSPENPTSETAALVLKTEVTPKAWAESHAWTYRRLYADELYLQGFGQEAKEEYKTIEKYLGENEKYLSPENSLNYSKISFQLIQLAAQKDFFGNHPAWIPGISYEVTNQFYRKEMETSFRLLYLTNWIFREFTSREAKMAGLNQLKTEMEDRLIQLRLSQAEQSHKLSQLDGQIKSYQKTAVVFEQHLQELQNQIEDEARRNIHHLEKKAKLKRALLGLSALAKAIPAGQPALAGIGTSMETILAMTDSGSAGNAISKLPHLLDSINQARKFEESRQDWNSRYYSFNLSEFMDLSPEERSQEIKRAKEFYSPIIQTLKDQVSQFKSLEMGQDALSAEIKRIQDTSPRFQDALKLLIDLNREKQLLHQNLVGVQNSLNSMDQERSELFVQANTLQNEMSNLDKSISMEFKSLAKSMAASAHKRLLTYKYFLVKAYQYRLLKAYPGNLDLLSLEEQLRQYINSEHQPSLDHQKLEQIFEVFYLDELGKINLALFEALDQGELKEEITEVTYNLSPSELYALSENKVVFLNSLKENLIASYHYNARLIDIESYPEYEITMPDPVASGYYDLSITHPGTFIVRNKTEDYLFSRPDLGEKGVFSWGSRIDVTTNTTTPYQTSPWLWSLFSNIWGNSNSQFEPQKLQGLYVRPGMATEFKLKLKRPGNISYGIKLLSLRLKFRYSFRSE